MTTFVNDTFSGESNGTNLTSHTGETGATWTTEGGSDRVQIYVGAAYLIQPASYEVATASGTPPSADYKASLVLSADGTTGFYSVYQGPVVRHTGVGTCYAGRYNDEDGKYELYKLLSNSATSLGELVEAAPPSDSVLSLVAVGTLIALQLDGVTKISATDASISAAGKAGFWCARTGSGSAPKYGIKSFTADDDISPPLIAGVVSAIVASSTSATLSSTAASGGTAPYDYQFQQAPDVAGAPGSWSNVGSAQTGLAVDVAPDDETATGLTLGDTYWFRCVVTDDASVTANSAPVELLIRVPGTYYISSSDGDDSNDGSLANPWETADAANAFGLVPGDTLLLKRGDTFPDFHLLIHPDSQPGSSTKITIGLYGASSSDAILQCGDSYAIKILNTNYVTIRSITDLLPAQIKVVGSGVTVTGTYPTAEGTTTSTTGGILIENSTTGTDFGHIVVDGVHIEDCLFGIYGISTSAGNTVGLNNCEIRNFLIRNCGPCGILFRTTGPGDTPHDRTGIIHDNLLIEDGVLTDISGTIDYDFDAPAPTWNGFGIFLINCGGAIVRRVFVADCGEGGYAGGDGGPTGLITAYCDDCIFSSCEVYRQLSPSGVDGDGLDIDIGCNDCIIEYCKAVNNTGPGILLFGTTGPTKANNRSIVRFNLCVNNGTEQLANGTAYRTYTNNVNDATVHNNTFYSNAASGKLIETTADSNTNFYNNIFAVRGGIIFGVLNGSDSLIGNCYSASGGSSFNLNGQTTLAGLRGLGHEKIGLTNYGASGDPLFTDEGDETETLPDDTLSSYSAYDLGIGSAAKGCGVDIFAEFGLAIGTDFHGNSEDAEYDAGAVYFGSSGEEAPAITSSASYSAAENQSVLGTPTGTGTPAGTWSLNGGTDVALVAMNSSSGQMTSLAPLNFEAKSSYTFGIRLANGVAPDATQTVTITVTNVNEAPTAIGLSSTSVPDGTDTTGGYTVGTLSFTDPDAGATGTFTVRPGGDAAVISITGGTTLKLTDGVLAATSKPSYSFTIRFTDQGSLTFDQAFTITVQVPGNFPGVGPGPTGVGPGRFIGALRGRR